MKLLQVTKTETGKEEALSFFDKIVKHLRKKGYKRIFICCKKRAPHKFFIAREWDTQDEEHAERIRLVDSSHNASISYKPIPLNTIKYEEIPEGGISEEG
ncbi:MAG: hypothetical protein M0R38_13150 [Bacteroidia bacterium]|nr:hypothetical protein [Bacteroidia bacterium]